MTDPGILSTLHQRDIDHPHRTVRGEGIGVYDIEFVVIDETLEPAALEPVLDSAAELGAQRLSACGDDPDANRLVERFAALCELAEQYGLGVDLECMAWRQVNSVTKAAAIVEAAGQRNGGVLVDALHLARCGGTASDLTEIDPHLLRSVQLCDARAALPQGTEAIIAEARGGRLPIGEGALPLAALIAAVPQASVLSVEVPLVAGATPEYHAQRNFEAAQTLFARCRGARQQETPA